MGSRNKNRSPAFEPQVDLNDNTMQALHLKLLFQ